MWPYVHLHSSVCVRKVPVCHTRTQCFSVMVRAVLPVPVADIIIASLLICNVKVKDRVPSKELSIGIDDII